MREAPRKQSAALSSDVLISAFLIVLFILLCAVVIASLRWRMVHDAPIMMYMAFLMDRFSYVPYRDFFDMNMPGAHLCYYLIGRCFGYGDLGFRCADLGVLAAVLVLAWTLLKKFGRHPAWFGTAVFGLLYLRDGPIMSLQREFLLLLLVAGAVYMATSFHRLHDVTKAGVIGVLFGVAATIKPHAAIGFPALLGFQVIEMRRHVAERREWLRGVIVSVLAACVGFCIPIGLITFYLWRNGALPAFLDIAGNYWPLYGELGAGHRPVTGRTRIGYLIHGYVLFGGYRLWFIPAIAGLYRALFRMRLERRQKDLAVLSALFAFLYSIYPVLSGQFWKYHWLIFAYFMVLLSSLCFADRGSSAGTKGRFYAIVLACAVVLITIDAGHCCKPYFTFASEVPHGGRPDAVAKFLKENLREGDTVQPLDWALGGAVHGMLMAEARLATPFVYAFHFYHHVSHSYIRELRSRFIEAFEEARPRFVIQYTGAEGWVSGDDTSKRFDALDELLDKDYVVRMRSGPTLVYERRGVERGADPE